MSTFIRRIRLYILIGFIICQARSSVNAAGVLTIRLRDARDWVYLQFAHGFTWWGYNGQDYANVNLYVECAPGLPAGHYIIYGYRPNSHSPLPIIGAVDWDGTHVTSAPTHRFFYGFESADVRAIAAAIPGHPQVPASGGYRVISKVVAISSWRFDSHTFNENATIYVGFPPADQNSTGGSDETSGGGGGGGGGDRDVGCDCNGCSIYDSASTNTDLGPAVDYTVPTDSSGGSMIGMARYNFDQMLASLHIGDTPIFYQPAFGPAIGFTVVYTQREANDPSWFDFSNLGFNWTFSWLGYLSIPGDPVSDNTMEVAVRPPSGGWKVYGGFNPHISY